MELFPIFGFIELQTVLVIGHIFGVALGAGVAVFSAVIFTKVMYDGVVTKNEMQLLHLASGIVALGLVIIVASGSGLFLLNPDRYIDSTKFLSKMSIVGILIVNGTLIHLLHIRALEKKLGKYLPDIPGFITRSYFMYAGGAISMTSWMSALILGVFRGVPYSYTTIMSVYLGVLVLAIIFALGLHSISFARKPH